MEKPYDPTVKSEAGAVRVLGYSYKNIPARISATGAFACRGLLWHGGRGHAMGSGRPAAGRCSASSGQPLAMVAVAVVLLVLGVPSAVADEIDVGRGPVAVYVPPAYDPATPTPLVMMLHGYSQWPVYAHGYFGLEPFADSYGFLYVHPHGLIDDEGYHYWNGTDACCDFAGATDDSGYLLAVIDEMKAQYNVDDNRVYILGHSNGGFMAHRMACDHPSVVAAIASLAGAAHASPLDCAPASPVHVLQIHGFLDVVVLYEGGVIFDEPYPSAVETVEQWASFNGCDLVGETSFPMLDLDTILPGDDTTVTRYTTGCDAPGSAELWVIEGGGHTPSLTQGFRTAVLDYFYAHPKAEAEGEDPIHDADQNGDNAIGLSELLRVIQFFNSAGFHCEQDTEDGYAPGPGDTTCPPHHSDYNPQDWTIGLSDLLRLIQFFNSDGYRPCDEGEDGFCPGAGP